MKHFFITGLPRSRTAWLANLLSTGQAICDHDALKAGFTIDVLERRFHELAVSDPFITAVGDADSGLVFISDLVRQRWPDAPWLLVKRDTKAAEASFETAFAYCNPYGPLMPDTFERCQNAYNATKVSTNCLEVSFEQLERPACWSAIFEHLLPGYGFNAERAALLNTLKVEVIPEKIHCDF